MAHNSMMLSENLHIAEDDGAAAHLVGLAPPESGMAWPIIQPLLHGHGQVRKIEQFPLILHFGSRDGADELGGEHRCGGRKLVGGRANATLCGKHLKLSVDRALAAQFGPKA